MSFAVTIEAVQEMLDEEMSLQTLSNQFSTQEIFDMVQNKEAIVNDDGLFKALMDAMYASRPQGVT